MAKTAGALALASYDEIFQSDSIPVATSQEQIFKVPLNELHPFENYPFRVCEDAAMQKNVKSIQEGGPVLPCLIRPLATWGYEIIVGQRTVHASELTGRDNIPAIIREMDDDTATILMVNANLPQEKVLPSELAWALRMKMEALCHRGRKVDGIDPGTLSVEVLEEQSWLLERMEKYEATPS